MLNDDILAVMALQPHWTSHKTPQMTRRGQIIRQNIQNAVAVLAPQIATQLHASIDDLVIDGRDNTGAYSKVPWVRFAIKERSPSATTGWYCVLLFDTLGTGTYLCLSHGSNDTVGRSYRRKSAEEISRLMSWARSVLSAQIASGEFETRVELGDVKGTSAEAYAETAVLARHYDERALRAGVDLQVDIIEFASLLRRVYEQESLGQSPDEARIQFEEAQDALDGNFEPHALRKGSRQGFGLSTAEKKVVELHAMSLAAVELRRLGFAVKDCSSWKPYDLEAVKPGQELIVEVKGTTGRGEAIILTYREVEAQRRAYPANCLVVVHSIVLDRSGAAPSASGGVLKVYQPWLIEEMQLQPTGYQYICPGT